MSNIYEELNNLNIEFDNIEPSYFSKEDSEKCKSTLKQLINDKKRDKGKVIILDKKVKKKFSRVKKVAACAAIFMGIIFVFNTGSVVQAVSQLKELFVKPEKIESVVKNNGVNLKRSVIKNGLRVTVEDLMLDDAGFVIKWNFKSDKKLVDQEIKDDSVWVLGDCKIYVDGICLTQYSAGYTKKLDDYSSQYVAYHDFDKKENLPDKMKIKIVCNNVMNSSDDIKGPWVYEFEVKKSDIRLKNEEKPIRNESFELEDKIKINLEKYTHNKIESRIYGKVTAINGNSIPNFYDAYLKGKNEKGENITFYLSAYGNECVEFDSSAEDFDKIKNSKKLKLTPYGAITDGDYAAKEDSLKKLGNEFTIELKN